MAISDISRTWCWVHINHIDELNTIATASFRCLLLPIMRRSNMVVQSILFSDEQGKAILRCGLVDFHLPSRSCTYLNFMKLGKGWINLRHSVQTCFQERKECWSIIMPHFQRLCGLTPCPGCRCSAPISSPWVSDERERRSMLAGKKPIWIAGSSKPI